MKLTLNLAVGPYVNRRRLYFAYASVAGALVLLLVLHAAYALRLRNTAGQIRAQLAGVDQQAGGMTAPAEVSPEAFRQQQEKISFANDVLLRDSFRWTELLNHLEETAVEGISIRGLQPDYKERSLQLRGLATGVDQLRQFLDSLIASDHFSEVYLLEQARTEVAVGDGKQAAVAFSIILKGAF